MGHLRQRSATTAGCDHVRYHSGGHLDFIRTAIMALQHFAEITHDDVELAKVHKYIVGLQVRILADHASGKDKAFGLTPALQHVRRSTQGCSPGALLFRWGVGGVGVTVLGERAALPVDDLQWHRAKEPVRGSCRSARTGRPRVPGSPSWSSEVDRDRGGAAGSKPRQLLDVQRQDVFGAVELGLQFDPHGGAAADVVQLDVQGAVDRPIAQRKGPSRSRLGGVLLRVRERRGAFTLSRTTSPYPRGDVLGSAHVLPG